VPFEELKVKDALCYFNDAQLSRMIDTNSAQWEYCVEIQYHD